MTSGLEPQPPRVASAAPRLRSGAAIAIEQAYNVLGTLTLSLGHTVRHGRMRRLILVTLPILVQPFSESGEGVGKPACALFNLATPRNRTRKPAAPWDARRRWADGAWLRPSCRARFGDPASCCNSPANRAACHELARLRGAAIPRVTFSVPGPRCQKRHRTHPGVAAVIVHPSIRKYGCLRNATLRRAAQFSSRRIRFRYLPYSLVSNAVARRSSCSPSMKPIR